MPTNEFDRTREVNDEFVQRMEAAMDFLGGLREDQDRRQVGYMVDKLIEQLYKHDGQESTLDEKRCREVGVDPTEPVNWGDLGVINVDKLGTSGYLVEITEAKDCPTLIAYLESEMKKLGFEVRVIADW